MHKAIGGTPGLALTAGPLALQLGRDLFNGAGSQALTSNHARVEALVANQRNEDPVVGFWADVATGGSGDLFSEGLLQRNHQRVASMVQDIFGDEAMPLEGFPQSSVCISGVCSSVVQVGGELQTVSHLQEETPTISLDGPASLPRTQWAMNQHRAGGRQSQSMQRGYTSEELDAIAKRPVAEIVATMRQRGPLPPEGFEALSKDKQQQLTWAMVHEHQTRGAAAERNYNRAVPPALRQRMDRDATRKTPRSVDEVLGVLPDMSPEAVAQLRDRLPTHMVDEVVARILSTAASLQASEALHMVPFVGPERGAAFAGALNNDVLNEVVDEVLASPGGLRAPQVVVLLPMLVGAGRSDAINGLVNKLPVDVREEVFRRENVAPPEPTQAELEFIAAEKELKAALTHLRQQLETNKRPVIQRLHAAGARYWKAYYAAVDHLKNTEQPSSMSLEVVEERGKLWEEFERAKEAVQSGDTSRWFAPQSTT